MKVDDNASAVWIVLDLVVLSGILHFTWEILQAPLFSSLDGASHFAGIVECAWATLGDVLIMIAAFFAARALAGPAWNKSALGRGVVVFLAVGLIATIALEYLNTEVLGRWTYGPDMLRLPVLGTGLAPLAQWVIIPLVVLWYLRRLQPHCAKTLER
ncbi:hypothetical protein [Primorskyibacter aestuariivivens]|uniref:hypothetical protein n=1 Tax=Primorskyibacter aestuariivivens TaxID=1888912 RepID=UPI0023008CFC|nr:hypothetical protein [Primorskyibacter aestuariivivens]MDA7429200.1 hypothetical protein [Primorskyibacter aestuariivivens]